MTVLTRGAVPEPMPPMETVAVDALGGEVIVKALLLSERLELQTNESPVAKRVATVLGLCVLMADKQPMWSAEQWESWGAAHYEEAMRIFEVVHRLSGLGPKN